MTQTATSAVLIRFVLIGDLHNRIATQRNDRTVSRATATSAPEPGGARRISATFCPRITAVSIDDHEWRHERYVCSGGGLHLLPEFGVRRGMQRLRRFDRVWRGPL
jgi:hypothetical protein